MTITTFESMILDQVFLLNFWVCINQYRFFLQYFMACQKCSLGLSVIGVRYSRHKEMLSSTSYSVYLGMIDGHLFLWFIVTFFVTLKICLLFTYFILTVKFWIHISLTKKRFIFHYFLHAKSWAIIKVTYN